MWSSTSDNTWKSTQRKMQDRNYKTPLNAMMGIRGKKEIWLRDVALANVGKKLHSGPQISKP